MYLLASTTTGVISIGDELEETQDVINLDCFYSELDTLEENETICTYVNTCNPSDGKMYEKIQDEYGIR